MAEYVGIDLGTTLSGLAYLKPDGNPEIVPNADGERLTPSVVYFDAHEDVKLVGSAARDGGDPERTIFQIKRHMDDPEHLIKVDGKVRRDPRYPLGQMDVVSVERTNEHFRILYDVKGRF